MATHTQTIQAITKPATKTIPWIRELPLLGSLPAYNRDRVGFLLRLTRERGDACVFHFGTFPAILFNTSEYAHGILVEHADDFDKGEFLRETFRPVIGNGLFISEGLFHRQQRKLMAPSFQPRHIVRYAEAMVGYGERIQEGWREGAVVDINREMTHLTMSVVGKVLFGADVFSEADELGGAVTAALDHINYRFSSLLPAPLDWPLPRHRRTKQAIAILEQRIQRMIDERRAAGAQQDDFLSILLRARDEDGAGMSDEQVRNEAITLFGAGHETTATALTWAWYVLATHPDSYLNLRNEVDSALRGQPPTYADLARLPYTLQVLKEAVRLYPPAFAVSRVSLREVDIDGYRIPPSTTVMLSPYTLHRRPDYFPDPERFDPERFTPENERSLPRYGYMPFGAGPRICIGNHFAMMEGHLLLATLAQRVTFELAPGQRIVPAPRVTLRPLDGMRMVVRRRAAGVDV
jgi:cytochrome P450